MLDRANVLLQLQQQAAAIFVDTDDQCTLAAHLWCTMINDESFLRTLQDDESIAKIPRALESLSTPLLVHPTSWYHVRGIDGSQIYPDRHQGTLCFLINVGVTECCYQQTSSFSCRSTPYLFGGDQIEYSVDWVNACRQELEFKAALQEFSCAPSENTIILFDGSLIFWHLEHAPFLAEKFATSYGMLLQEMYQKKYVIAGYISAPRNRELMQLLNYFIEHANVAVSADDLKPLLDVDLMNLVLPVGSRTAVFVSCSPLQWAYATYLQPTFFYCNTGYEIVRIEIPYWIGQQTTLVTNIAAIILDQCHKGRGYPVALAEAHEQAVVKGSDRDFFYQCIAKIARESQRKMNFSYKYLKKRLIGI